MRHKELLQYVVNSLNSFDPETQGVLEYIAEFLPKQVCFYYYDIIYIH